MEEKERQFQQSTARWQQQQQYERQAKATPNQGPWTSSQGPQQQYTYAQSTQPVQSSGGNIIYRPKPQQQQQQQPQMYQMQMPQQQQQQLLLPAQQQPTISSSPFLDQYPVDGMQSGFTYSVSNNAFRSENTYGTYQRGSGNLDYSSANSGMYASAPKAAAPTIGDIPSQSRGINHESNNDPYLGGPGCLTAYFQQNAYLQQAQPMIDVDLQTQRLCNDTQDYLYNPRISLEKHNQQYKAQLDENQLRSDESLASHLQKLELSCCSQMLLSPYFDQLPFEDQIEISNPYLPPSYQVAVPQLTPNLFKRFEATILFYLFYNYPYDQVQLEAHNELLSRGWVLHRKSNKWFILALDESQSAQNQASASQNASKKRRIYMTSSQSQTKLWYYFDTQEWKKVPCSIDGSPGVTVPPNDEFTSAPIIVTATQEKGGSSFIQKGSSQNDQANSQQQPLVQGIGRGSIIRKKQQTGSGVNPKRASGNAAEEEDSYKYSVNNSSQASSQQQFQDD